MSSHHDGGTPSATSIRKLSRAWGGAGYQADDAYLHEVVTRAGMVDSATILECGSGLTSLALALWSPAPTVSLEQHAPSSHKVKRVLDQIPNHQVTVVDTSLVKFGQFSWYDWQPPEDIRFALVVCDGPPGNTPGGRYGLLPRAAQHLAPGAIILLDDADRPGELDSMERWKREFGVKEEPRPSGARHAVLRMPS